MNNITKVKLIATLYRAAEGDLKGNEHVAGLCNLIWDYCSEDFVAKNVTDWEHYSGDPTFPIGGIDIYNSNFIMNTLWEGEQLELRKSLAKHLLAKLINNDYTS